MNWFKRLYSRREQAPPTDFLSVAQWLNRNELVYLVGHDFQLTQQLTPGAPAIYAKLVTDRDVAVRIPWRRSAKIISSSTPLMAGDYLCITFDISLEARD